MPQYAQDSSVTEVMPKSMSPLLIIPIHLAALPTARTVALVPTCWVSTLANPFAIVFATPPTRFEAMMICLGSLTSMPPDSAFAVDTAPKSIVPAMTASAELDTVL